MASKECGAQSKKRGGHNQRDYWLTMDAAKELSMLERNDRGRQARRYFIECEKRLRAQAGALAAPKDYPAALRALADSEERRQRLEVEHRVAVAKTEVAEQKAGVLADLRALEGQSLPLSVWLARTATDHGCGPLVALKTLRALGVLHRELVKGCRTTKESAICQEWIENGTLFYSSRDFLKNKKFEVDGKSVAVIDSDGRPVVGTSRVILVTPEGGGRLLRWMLRRPEFALRLLLRSPGTTGPRILTRLAGRYLFSEANNHAWDELLPAERDQGIRFTVPAVNDAPWRVYCDVGGRRVTAEGLTLEAALADLAEHCRGK